MTLAWLDAAIVALWLSACFFAIMWSAGVTGMGPLKRNSNFGILALIMIAGVVVLILTTRVA